MCAIGDPSGITFVVIVLYLGSVIHCEIDINNNTSEDMLIPNYLGSNEYPK